MASNRKGGARMPPADEESGFPGSQPGLKRKTSKQKREEVQAARRARALSDGSTLGAFFHPDKAGEAPKSKHTGLKKRRSSKRNKEGLVGPAPVAGYNNLAAYHMPLPPTTSGTGSDLGDLASLAIAGLGNDLDIDELMGGPAPTPKHKNRRAPPKKKPSLSSAGSQLPTIVDDSETMDISTQDFQQRMQSYGMVGGGTKPGRRSSNRQSVNTVDSLRVSEMSTDMDDDIQGMLSSLDRDASLYVSETSDMNGSNTNNRGGDPALSNRTSLLGSSILDKQSSGSLFTQGSHGSAAAAASYQKQAAAASSHTKQAPSQQEEIANFAAMLHADYGAADIVDQGGQHPLKDTGKPNEKIMDPTKDARPTAPKKVFEQDELSIDESVLEDRQSVFMEALDPTNWLIGDVKFADDGVPFFEESAGWTLAGMVRHFLYNPISPEFTSLQQFCWAVNIGIFMGFYTAFWKEIIEKGVEFMWKELPEALLEWGVFTDLDGSFPLYHYMWICPAFWGGILSYIFAILPTPIPGQNEWIQNLHTRGVQDSETFLLLFVLATLGMMSGLSLGPELPLVLTAGMIGSWLGIKCKQSVLQARVMNITAGSAAVGGFFGFPMAGALFVMEIPHRMGLQYFEALSPATIASIVAVLCNRLTTGNDVTGYYSYPFLTTSLPSEIFSSAIVFGLFGALVGTLYAKSVLQLKHLVHDFFHAHDDHDEEDEANGSDETDNSTQEREETPLLVKTNGVKTNKNPQSPAEPPFHEKITLAVQKYLCCVIPHEPTRAAAAGVVAGGLVGVICMFVPHVMFWGEAQLQTLIDKGRTPLPVFGQEDEPTAALTALGYCMIDPNDSAAVQAGFGMGCSFVITIAKMVVTGLSLGTGIIGGHFWGPLFSGCAASHFLTDLTRLMESKIGFGGRLAAYPCVTILCTMGSTHVVTFRAHTAIMLILTLTISAFDPEDHGDLTAVAGDYSAVFPLLVISVFVSLMVSRQTVFYGAQRSRGDIMALPEVLCEPGKEGMPMVLDYEGDQYDDDSEYSSEGYMSDPDVAPARQLPEPQITQEDIEKEFNDKAGAMAAVVAPLEPALANSTSSGRGRTNVPDSSSRGISPLPPRPRDKKPISEELPKAASSQESPGLGEMSSSRLDELLSQPLDNQRPTKARHRRIQSAPDVNFGKRFIRDRSGTLDKNMASEGSVGGSAAGGGGRHSRSDSYGSQASGKVMRVATIGHLTVEQPSLMDQARLRAATSVIVESRHVRHPSMPSRIPRGRHSRQNSASSIGVASGGGGPPLTVALGVDSNALPGSEVERAYASAVNRERAGGNHNRTDNGSYRPGFS